MKQKEEHQNTWAYNIQGTEIHISEAQSGKNGYFCLGCKREMIAYRSDKINRSNQEIRRSYFGHDSNAVKNQPKCTYSDETYRHKLAKEILLRIKKIKVPTLYKYPPKNVVGNPILIEKAKFIEASFVTQELYFYENEIGEIQHSKSFSSKENTYLLLKPDIIFFDKNNIPILLVEIVATHKINEQKKLDLKRLGINTVQVTIPKNSKEEIENTFSYTNRTKWIYNYEQENTPYISTSDSNSEGISSIDEDQRNFFEESFKCRRSQINNLIRTIRKSLESEQFRIFREYINGEISRVEENTKRNRESLKQLRTGYNQRIISLQEKIRKRIKDNLNHEYENEKKNDKTKHENLEGDYIRRSEIIEGKKREFEEQEKKLDNEFNRILQTGEYENTEFTSECETIIGKLDRFKQTFDNTGNEETETIRRRYLSALEFIKSGTYKNWFL